MYMYIQYIHMYILHVYTVYTHVHIACIYSIYTCTCILHVYTVYTHVHITCMYSIYTAYNEACKVFLIPPSSDSVITASRIINYKLDNIANSLLPSSCFVTTHF